MLCNTSTYCAGGSTASAPSYCFPPAFQLPPLNSPELTALLQTLANESCTEPDSKDANVSEVTEETLSAITNALKKALAMPSAAKPPPVQSKLTQTTNGAVTFSSSGSARTNLFFKCEGSGPYGHPTISDTLLRQVLSCLDFDAASSCFSNCIC